MLPNLEDISPNLRGSKIFSKLDAASGFHQIPLDEENWLLTFITPFRRFCFKRLAFRISSDPEIFQCRMTELLVEDIEGVQVIIDNILIHSRSMEEHDKRLEETIFWPHYIRQRDTTQ